MRSAFLGLSLLVPVSLIGCSAKSTEPFNGAQGGTTGTSGAATGTSGVATGTTTGAATGTSGAATGTSTGVATGSDTSVGVELCGTTLNPVAGGVSGQGHSTRYWDCCKPHCSWPDNTPDTASMCSVDNVPLPHEAKGSETLTQSGCQEASGGFTCYGQSPWAPCEDLAFGFAAVPLGGPDACGTCFKLEFDGRNKQVEYDQNAVPDPGSVQLAGKTMIVMASNTGGDVGGGQFDIMIPGGGVGIFPQGCQNQWGALGEDILGPTHGGMRSKCQEEFNQANQGGEYVPHMPLADLQACVKSRCDQAFAGDASRQHLLDGCYFYADWMGGADNPTFTYSEVECPQVLLERY